ncbi:MAG: colanic acid biosynthesis glycosyltransferase WcaL [Flavobacteriaceae bacterium]|nr:MAG: colanic acid biosynthesis glycosyltransferase WcaL [Flavobacteriaceae bacterium]
MRIAYFVNQYPKVSHSFIRREILELENQSVEVHRYSVKRDARDVVGDDIHELNNTTYLAEQKKWVIVGALFQVLLCSPVRCFQAISAAARLGLRSQVGLLKHAIYFIEACVLLDDLQKHGIQHVHAHFGTNSATIVMLAKLLGNISYSFTVHGPEEFDKPEALSLGEKIQHAAFVIAISSFARSQLFRWCDLHCWKKIHIVHCALGSDFLGSKKTPVPDNHRLICVGRLCEQKGQLLLIEAVHRIKDKGMPIELILAGDGPMRHEIEGLIEQYGLTSQVHITGWISGAQVLDEIQASRALVLPSFAEGLPVVLMEACALHRPSVTTSIAGIPELIKDKKGGWLIPAGSVDDLCDALIDVLETPIESLDVMGAYAYQQVCINHDVSVECAKLKTLFQGAIKGD